MKRRGKGKERVENGEGEKEERRWEGRRWEEFKRLNGDVHVKPMSSVMLSVIVYSFIVCYFNVHRKFQLFHFNGGHCAEVRRARALKSLHLYWGRPMSSPAFNALSALPFK